MIMLSINKKGKYIDLNYLNNLKNPIPISKTHFPIRHDKAVSLIEKEIEGYNYVVTDRTLALSNNDQRLFGVIFIRLLINVSL